METCAQPLMTWSQWHPPVGAFIAVLALLGVIVPWLYREPKDMKAPEKALWTFVMLLLFGLELRTLYLDRDQHDREQEAANCEELQNFKAIAESLGSSVARSKEQYDSTITQVKGVLKSAKDISELSKKNLEDITGGKSFAIVYPSPTSQENDSVTLNVHNYGAQGLLGLVVTVYFLPDGPLPADRRYGELEALQATTIGSVAPDEGRRVPGAAFTPSLSRDGIAHYHAYINAQNSGVEEAIDFKRSESGRGWAWQLSAWRYVSDHDTKGAVYLPAVTRWIRYVRRVPWTEPDKVAVAVQGP